MDVEEKPFLGSESGASDEEQERLILNIVEDSTVLSSSHAEHSAKRVRQKYLIRWGSVVAMFVIVMLGMFGLGVLVGHYTTSNGGHAQHTGSDQDANSSDSSSTLKEEICENPPVLLISLDGFWNGYFSRNVTPTLSNFATGGVKAQYVRSAYPTKTFPNHFTIVTGLYPESHGIIDNHFYDKDLKDTFYLGNNEPKWWLGEPVWITAAKEKLKSGTFFWPGSEVPIQGMLPTYYRPYDSSIPYEERVLKILEWLDLPSSERPQFLTLYLNEPDHSGHIDGPDSVEVDAALGRVDEVVQDLIVGLKVRGIYDCVNIVIVSDHGMVASNSTKKFFISPYIPEGYSVSFPTYGVTMNINVENGDERAVGAVYNALQNISQAPFRVYYLDDMPLRLHVGHHNRQRYGDIYVSGDLGSYITPKMSSQVPKGEHGYDNNEVSMQSVFLAHGPAFKEGYVAPPFDNIQIYNLLCALLRISPSVNNGTFGALHHMLRPDIVEKLPPVEETEGVEGVKKQCVLPDFDCQTCFCSITCQDDDTDFVSTSAEVVEYQNKHLPLGVPRGGEGKGACLLTNKHSVTLYSTVLNIPVWTAYTLTNKMHLQSVDGEIRCYQADPRVPSVQCSNYDASSDYSLVPLSPGIDEYHFIPVTNAVLQQRSYYQNVWSEWEQQLMQWTSSYGTLHIISGCLLDSDGDGMRDDDGDYDHWLNGKGSVAIPSGFYSMVTRCTEARTGPSCQVTNTEVLGILLHHRNISTMSDDATDYLKFHLSTVSDVESATGINFFPGLLPEQQAALKLHITTDLWT